MFVHVWEYSPHFKISVVLVFKFYPTKSIVLSCNEIHLIKSITSPRKYCTRINIEPIKYLLVYVTLRVPIIYMHSLRN